mgnify:CR=1 FL=1
MRFVIFGVGAIGGTIAGNLSLVGRDVVGIARGRMLEAVTRDGLLLRRPDGEHRIDLACHASPACICLVWPVFCMVWRC